MEGVPEGSQHETDRTATTPEAVWRQLLFPVDDCRWPRAASMYSEHFAGNDFTLGPESPNHVSFFILYMPILALAPRPPGKPGWHRVESRFDIVRGAHEFHGRSSWVLPICQR